jgi:dTDP-4-amino-4,6-dideoxygalactose transaminase
VFIVSYIYGIIFPIDEIAEYCKEKGILLVEDAAESYYGNDYNGNLKAVLTLFSFGNIKRYTSFGGALSFVRDPDIYRKMAKVHNTFPVQTKAEFLKKLARSLGIATVLNNKKGNYTFRSISNLFNFNYKEFAVRNLRGFGPTKDFLGKFNKQPSVPLMAFLYDRLKHFDPESFKASNKKIVVSINKNYRLQRIN